MNRIFIFVGASGSGKTTLEHGLKKLQPEKFHNVVSATTREPKKHEKNGIDYLFLSEEAFSEMPFAECETFAGARYGTPAKELETTKDLLLTLEPLGAKRLTDYVNDKMPEKKVFVIFFAIPEEIRIKNMYERGESKEQIERRLAKDDVNERFRLSNLKPHLIIEKLSPNLTIDFWEKIENGYFEKMDLSQWR